MENEKIKEVVEWLNWYDKYCEHHLFTIKTIDNKKVKKALVKNYHEHQFLLIENIKKIFGVNNEVV